MRGYATSLEHILTELERIDLLIQRQVARFREAGRKPGDPFRGLHISEEDVDALLGGASPMPAAASRPALGGRGVVAELFRRVGLCESVQSDTTQPASHRPQVTYPTLEVLQDVEAEIGQRKVASLAQGVELRLESLMARFGLGDFERDALLVCLAPELDLKYHRLYAYLQDDVTRKRPSVDLVLSLLWKSGRKRDIFPSWRIPGALAEGSRISSRAARSGTDRQDDDGDGRVTTPPEEIP